VPDTDADTRTDGAAVHPRTDVSDVDAITDRFADAAPHRRPDAHTGAHIDAWPDDDGRIGDDLTDQHAIANANTHADARTGDDESRTRGPRIARFGRDDRRGDVDLARVSQLTDTSTRVAGSSRSPHTRVVALRTQNPTP
jgi:hypothetical protein